MILVHMVILIKIGGSAFDLGSKCIINLCKKIQELSKDNNFILTVGGGPALDVLKNIKNDYGISDKLYENLSIESIVIHAKLVEELISNAEYVNSKNLNLIPNLLKNKKIPILTHIHNPLTKENLKNSKTDAHIIEIANFFNISEIIFLKDTKGVFNKDPNIHKKAIFLENIKIKDFKKISRIGLDGRDEHLIEDSALKLFNKSNIVKSISILDCKDVNLLENYINKKTGLSISTIRK